MAHVVHALALVVFCMQNIEKNNGPFKKMSFYAYVRASYLCGIGSCYLPTIGTALP